MHSNCPHYTIQACTVTPCPSRPSDFDIDPCDKMCFAVTGQTMKLSLSTSTQCHLLTYIAHFIDFVAHFSSNEKSKIVFFSKENGAFPLVSWVRCGT